MGSNKRYLVLFLSVLPVFLVIAASGAQAAAARSRRKVAGWEQMAGRPKFASPSQGGRRPCRVADGSQGEAGRGAPQPPAWDASGPTDKCCGSRKLRGVTETAKERTAGLWLNTSGAAGAGQAGAGAAGPPASTQRQAQRPRCAEMGAFSWKIQSVSAWAGAGGAAEREIRC